jgi:2-keto-4-pentenoate hydratase/2-oxohepta-3-ene-1,7-dioic acid hydratase in catechol pathway
MADKVRDVLKPLAKMASGFKTSMNGVAQGQGRDLDVNGEKRQRGDTKTMIFGCEYA